MFEVQDLRYATLATVSRCGMVWFSEDVLSTDMIFENYIQTLRHVPLEESEDDAKYLAHTTAEGKEEQVSPMLQVRWGLEHAGSEGELLAIRNYIVACAEEWNHIVMIWMNSCKWLSHRPHTAILLHLPFLCIIFFWLLSFSFAFCDVIVACYSLGIYFTADKAEHSGGGVGVGVHLAGQIIQYMRRFHEWCN